MTESLPVKYSRESAINSGATFTALVIVGSVIALPILLIASRRQFEMTAGQLVKKFAPRVSGQSQPGNPGQNF